MVGHWKGSLRWSAVCVVLALTGCGVLSGYHADWRAARDTLYPCNSLSGAWQGYWESKQSGHTGNLRAIIVMRGDGQAYARFHARFFRLFTYQYELPLRVKCCGDRIAFCGAADLGALAGGVYRCQGYATDCCFVARYCSANDHGIFVMQREGCCCRSCSLSADDLPELDEAPLPPEVASPSDSKP